MYQQANSTTAVRELAQGADDATDGDSDEASPAERRAIDAVYLPIIVSGSLNSGTANKPLMPDSYEADGSEPPDVAVDPLATECASFINFTNFSNEAVYIFWVGPGSTEMLYNVLDSGRNYWQHTYRYNQWRVRDDNGRLVLSFGVESCQNSAKNIFIDDLPPCGGILTIGLWDQVREEPIEGYENLVSDISIDLGQLPPAVLHVQAQDAVESIEIIGGGAVVALNEPPYNYPSNGSAWKPTAGEITLIFNAYRKDNAVGSTCDTRELTLGITYSGLTPTVTPTITPSVTVTATATTTPMTTPMTTPFVNPTVTTTGTPMLTPSVTQTPATPTPSLTPEQTATPTLSPTLSPTATPSPTFTSTPDSCGQIEYIQFFDLDANAPIATFAPLQNGQIVTLDQLPPRFNIDVVVSGNVESVLFALNGDQSLENRAPYRYPGADVNPWMPAEGGYTLVTTAYALDDASGQLCDQKIINFFVQGSANTPTPTLTSTPTPGTTPAATLTPSITPTATPTATPTTNPTGTACLGDRTWIDANENGIQDNGETSLAGIDLYLWADDNTDGQPDRIIATATTDNAGQYMMCGLNASLVYILEFGTNASCHFTLADQGTDEAVDSDASPTNGLTAPIQLDAGENTTSVDAGYVCGEFS